MDISSDVMHSSKTAKGLTVIGLKSRISILSISLTFVRNKTCEILHSTGYVRLCVDRSQQLPAS